MFKQISILLVLSSLTANVYASTVCGQDNAQICALQLSQEAFADMDCTDDPQVVAFTLTNNTPGPIAIESDIFDGNISGATVAITGGSCGNSAPPGKCSIEVTVTPDCDGITPGDSIAVDAVLNVDPDVNQGDLFGPIQLEITNPGFIALAAGYSNVAPDNNTATPSHPYYVVYNAEGNWTTTTLPDQGSLQTAACSGEGQDATCFVAGSISSSDKNAATSGAFAYVSTNGGVDWDETASVNGTNVVDIACGDNANCAVIAENASQNSIGDAIYKTTDKGESWSEAFQDDQARLLSIDCDGLICAAGGDITVNSTPNRFFIWAFAFSTVETSQAALGTNKATACSDSGTNKICFFGGYVEQSDPSIEATKVPSLYYVKPGDTSPTEVDLTELVNSGSIDAIDCTLLGGNVACVAGGEGTFYINFNVFNPSSPAYGWTASVSSDIQVIESISCASNGFCAVAGQNTNEEATIIAGGIINAGQGIFNSISCTTTTAGDDVSCIASGKTEDGEPLVWINKSVIATPNAWAPAPVSLTTSGAMNATGAASGN